MDPFKFLIDSGKATPELLKKTYLSLAKKIHPDMDSDDPEATRRMQELNAAYEDAIQLLKSNKEKPPEEKNPVNTKRLKTLVFHISSVVDDYLRYVSHSVSFSSTVKSSIERIKQNLICIEQENLNPDLNTLAKKLLEYFLDPLNIELLSDIKRRKELKNYSEFRNSMNLFLRDLFIENRRLFIRSDIHQLAVIFTGKLKSIISESQKNKEENKTILELCDALSKSLHIILPLLKEYHNENFIV